MLADMTLPEVEKVHVVDRRLSALDLEEYSRIADSAKVVRSKSQFLAREQANPFAFEPQLACEVTESRLHGCTAATRLVCLCDPSQRLGRV
jgi:hypothetical protein